MRRLFGLVIVVVLAFGNLAAVQAQGELSIAQQRLVDVDDVEPLSLSPDGRWLAVWNRAGEEPALCTLDAATLAEHRCAPIPRGSVAADSVAWSPDGTRLAVTENALRYGEDGDIWVVDVEAGTATNLTEDGAEDVFRAPEGTPMDLAPAWSPDGTELIFSRSVRFEGESEEDETESTVLYRIAATGGEPREVAKVSDYRFAVYAGLRWLADGTLLYSIDISTEDPANGVWSVAADGGTPRQIVRTDAAELGRALVTDLSAKGQALLLVGQEDFALLDLATGELTPVEMPAGSRRPLAATFSPDGSQLLVSRPADPGGELVVLDLATGAEQVVGATDEWIATEDNRSGLTWASNNLVFGPTRAAWGVLVQLTTA